MTLVKQLEERIYHIYFENIKSKELLAKKLSAIRNLNDFEKVVKFLEEDPDVIDSIFNSTMYPRTAITLPAPTANTIFQALDSIAQDAGFI